ncbi:MAG: hypothetical protein OXI87_14860 [Albidovulum sp.]|nr:hypothetical protein [Albidovulum sp.]MDE0531847.1 hypothetical protein [Albidovulum sp.]
MLERVSDAAKAIHGRGDMAKALAKRWRGMIKSGRLQPVVDELKSRAPQAFRSDSARSREPGGAWSASV